MWGLKMLLKKTCERVLLSVKLLAINLQAFKFTKNELLHTYFSRIFKLLFIILSRNHFLEGGFMVQGGGGVFRCEGFFFKWGGGAGGGTPHGGASVLMGFFEQNHRMGVGAPRHPHYGKLCNY